MLLYLQPTRTVHYRRHKNTNSEVQLLHTEARPTLTVEELRRELRNRRVRAEQWGAVGLRGALEVDTITDRPGEYWTVRKR